MLKPCFRDRDATLLCEDSKNKILYHRLAVLPRLLCSRTSRHLGTHDLTCVSEKGWDIQKVLGTAMLATQDFRCMESRDGCHLLDICYVPKTVVGALCVFAHSINSNPLDSMTKNVLLPPFHEKENWDLKRLNDFSKVTELVYDWVSLTRKVWTSCHAGVTICQGDVEWLPEKLIKKLYNCMFLLKNLKNHIATFLLNPKLAFSKNNMAIFWLKSKGSNVNQFSKYIEVAESADVVKITMEGNKWLEVGEYHSQPHCL